MKRYYAKNRKKYCDRNHLEKQIATIIKRFSDKSYLKRKTVSKLHKIFESFLTAGNTRENLPERSLQRRFFAVYCI